MNRLTILAITLSFLLGSVLTAQNGVSWFSARLTGDQEVPAVSTKATGWGIVRFDARTNDVSIFVEARGLSARMAHLHVAPSGQNGPVIVPLQGGPTRWTGRAVLNASGPLLAGNTYLNLHTQQHPGGEIRGQVVPAKSMRFVAHLDGSQEVPPVRTLATGEGVAFLHAPDNVLMYHVQSSGLQNVTAAHIHIAPRGQNGPVIFPLNGSNGDYCGVTPRLDPQQMQALQNNGLYFNIHTGPNSGGEIRGQILNQGEPQVFFGRLDGRNSVPPVQTNANGQACVELTPDGRLAYEVRATGLQATAAHIHKGTSKQNGPVVFPLQGGPTHWKGMTAPLTPAQLQDLRQGMYYVNVHTQSNPGGEIRDQLHAATRPATYGGACQGSAGFAEIGADGFACVGTPFDVTLAGTPARSAAVLLLGFHRDRLGNAPLPLDLAGLGAPGCFLLTSFGQLPPLIQPTDRFGCASQEIMVPFALGLRDLDFYGQWVVLDRGANTANLVVSNALSVHVH